MKPPLGLFAVFYDGETRPVAGFVIDQDAEDWAKKYSGGASYEVRHVQVVENVRGCRECHEPERHLVTCPLNAWTVQPETSEVLESERQTS